MLAAVRVRGVPDTPKKVAETLQTLRLHNKNNCVLLQDTAGNRGMLNRAKDFVAYGDVDTETVRSLLAQRGSVDGMNVDAAATDLGYDDVDAVVEALADEETTIHKLHSQGLQVPFRLSPPSKGFSNPKQHYNQGGSLGERDDMDELLRRMI